MEPAAFTSVVLLGRGRLGTSLAGALDAAGIPQRSVPARERERVRATLEEGPSLVVLAVPDAAIRVTAEAVLAAAGPRRSPVVHLSGALGEAELRALSDAGFETGSFHPFLPFSEARPPEFFAGATIGVQASSEGLLAQLSDLARAIGAQPRQVEEAQRVLYHAAAVMASNYLVALASQAAGLLEEIGWDREAALAALLPLMAGTVDNLKADGLPNALSGPLRRGDAATIGKHIEALSATAPPLTLRTYAVLAETAVTLAVAAGLPAATAEQVRALLPE